MLRADPGSSKEVEGVFDPHSVPMFTLSRGPTGSRVSGRQTLGGVLSRIPGQNYLGPGYRGETDSELTQAVPREGCGGYLPELVPDSPPAEG